MHQECLLAGPHPANLTVKGSGCSSKAYNWTDPDTVCPDGLGGDKDISEIFESDPNSLDWRERLLLISRNLGHAPKARVGDLQIISLTWIQVLQNHMIKCNLRCSACCHHFRFLSLCQKLLRCSDVSHTRLSLCVSFYFFISFISFIISLFPQQTSSGKLCGCRSFHLLVQQQGFYHFHSSYVSHWEVFWVHCVIAKPEHILQLHKEHITKDKYVNLYLSVR